MPHRGGSQRRTLPVNVASCSASSSVICILSSINKSGMQPSGNSHKMPPTLISMAYPWSGPWHGRRTVRSERAGRTVRRPCQGPDHGYARGNASSRPGTRVDKIWPVATPGARETVEDKKELSGNQFSMVAGARKRLYLPFWARGIPIVRSRWDLVRFSPVYVRFTSRNRRSSPSVKGCL